MLYFERQHEIVIINSFYAVFGYIMLYFGRQYIVAFIRDPCRSSVAVRVVSSFSLSHHVFIMIAVPPRTVSSELMVEYVDIYLFMLYSVAY